MSKSNRSAGLGKALKNKLQRKKYKQMGDRAPIFYQQTQQNEEEKRKAKMRSMVDQNSLTEFLQIAEISEQNFHADRDIKFKEVRQQMRNKKIIPNQKKRHFLVQQMVDQQLLTKLQLPRRPDWKNLTKQQLERKQAQAYLNWRKGLAKVEQTHGEIQITPYEKNIQVWRQLWRVVDRSDVIAQIVDGRDPLFYRSEDLVQYVKQVNPKKQSLVIINKSDLVDVAKIKMWNEYFIQQNINHVFFSAKQPVVQEAEQTDALSETTQQSKKNQNVGKFLNRPQILAVTDLIELFELFSFQYQKTKVQIGLVGYPNVGKSSVINSVFGVKKVAVASLPGKTKHFQTLNLSEKVTLCDCPGLVFPRISSSYAQMTLNGLVPIDTCKAYLQPMQILALRIKKKDISTAYSLHWKPEQPYDGQKILDKHARMKGFYSGNGQPNLATSARNILKDYVNGVLSYAKHPPGYEAKIQEQSKKAKELNESTDPSQLEKQEVEEQADTAETNFKKKQAIKQKEVDGQFFGVEGQQAVLSYQQQISLLNEEDLLDILDGKQLPTIHVTKQMRKQIKFALKRGEKPEEIIKKVFLGQKDKIKTFNKV